jgi:biopolymer transport protein ExbB
MTKIFQDGLDMVTTGGSIMYLLAAIACILYGTCFAAFAFVQRGNLVKGNNRQWPDWIAAPESAPGRLGEAIRYALHGPRLTIKIVQRRLDEVRLNILEAIDRRLLVINTLVAAAPLAGLLGTVMGMLAMFSGLSQGKGKAGMQLVADGMQEALITTQTGLTIALPGLFIALIIKSRRDRIRANLVRLESAILAARFHKTPNP